MERRLPHVLEVVLSLSLLSVFSVASDKQAHHGKAANAPQSLDDYVEQVSELSSRARANVYFANPQSVFRGAQVSFVNVGKGNLTFLRRDMVATGRIPLLFARVFDSSGKGSIDFGPGWTLSAAESVTIVKGTAHLFSENGSTIDFVGVGENGFQLERDYPSDYVSLRFVDGSTLEARLRTGLTKTFSLIGGVFRLVEVTDRNGNNLVLSYQNGLLSRITNTNHSLTVTRNPQGRIISVQDDANRTVGFKYDSKGRLIEADDLGGKPWTYSYSDEDRLKEARDPLQRLNLAAFFDESGRVHRLQLPSGTIQFDFDSAARITTVTDRKNLVSRFYQNEDGITVRVMNPLGEETAIGLGEGRNVTSLSRDGAVIERMEYDRQHHLITRRSVLGSNVVDRSYEYDVATGLLTAIRPTSGTALVFARDNTGNLTSATLADGTHTYGYSDGGDLASFSFGNININISVDQDGLIASLRDGDNSVSTMGYKAGGQLSEVAFAGGRSAKYTYGASGLRSKLTYKDGWAVEYGYDPAGNLGSTKVLDPKNKQTAGQLLTLDESYRLIKRVTFAGKITDFDYDRNGNLTMIREGKSVTRFEYDALNRLTAVITPDGQRLTHNYEPGERSIVDEYEHSKPTVVDRWDSGLTFGSQAEVLSTRPIFGSIGPLRFAENLGVFQLQNAEGTEIVTPDSAIEAPLRKLQFVSDDTLLQNRQNRFNRPFNPIFVPAEYASINCCPMCIINPARCWECDAGPDPTAIASMEPSEEDLGSTSFQVTFTGTFSGTNPSITFDKTGITTTIQSHTTTSISATFDITKASVGAYVVTVSDSGGSDTANLRLLPFIDSIEPTMGLVGNNVHVTITGKGFGTAPTLTLGGGITATGVTTSDTQITATFNIPAVSTAGGDQSLTVTNQGFATQGDIFHVQVPVRMVRFGVSGAPGGVGPLLVITNGSVVDLNGNIRATGECGMYRNYAFDIEESDGTSINGNYIFTEAFSNYSTTVSGLTAPPTQSQSLSGDGLVTDLQFFGTRAPSCPGANDHESYDMSFSVTSGSGVFPLSTIQHVDRGNFNGTATVNATIIVP